jgi:ABC-2 type transport system ATP-binding protein
MTVVADAALKAGVSALSVESVSHAYGARIALDDVSFDIAPASFTVLLGLNGAGKSTLFSVVTHLYVSRSGVVRIFGYDVARDSGAALTRLGVVFQQRTLDPDLSVAQNLAYHGALHGIGRRETRERWAM